jgi:methionyl-tRNA formyltransferase
MEVGKDLDTGGIYRKETVPLNTNKSLSAIRNDLCKKGTELLIDCFKSGFGIPLPQSGEASYANKVKPDEHRIIWSQGAEEIHRIIRLENAWTTLNGKRLQILEAKIEMAGRQEPGEIKGTLVGAGKGNLDLITVKPEGRKKISAKDWINGIRVTDDTRLGE